MNIDNDLVLETISAQRRLDELDIEYRIKKDDVWVNLLSKVKKSRVTTYSLAKATGLPVSTLNQKFAKYESRLASGMPERIEATSLIGQNDVLDIDDNSVDYSAFDGTFWGDFVLVDGWPCAQLDTEGELYPFAARNGSTTVATAGSGFDGAPSTGDIERVLRDLEVYEDAVSGTVLSEDMTPSGVYGAFREAFNENGDLDGWIRPDALEGIELASGEA